MDFAGNTRYREFEAGTILTVRPRVITIRDTTFIHLTMQAERSQVNPDPARVSKDITEKLMDYLVKCSNSFDVTRWTYHELEEELLSNLDLFGEFFPTSYSKYI